PPPRPSRAASALIATSIAPDVAPTTKRTAQSCAGEAASAGRTAVSPKSPTVTGVSLGPRWSSSTPVPRIESKAPTPTRRSARPSCASLAPEERCTAGRAAPHAPQKIPSAAKPRRTFALRTPEAPHEHSAGEERRLDERDRKAVQHRRPERHSRRGDREQQPVHRRLAHSEPRGSKHREHGDDGADCRRPTEV